MHKKHDIYRIAIVGPDGAGKTTVSQELKSKISDSSICHAVKDRNHLLYSTKIGFRLWKKAKEIDRLFSFIIQYFLYYPLEYLENWARFRLKEDVSVIIYDRHPIDRVRMKYELEFSVKKRSIIYCVVYWLQSILAFSYLYVFPKVNCMFVLLPETNLCYERARGQYVSAEQAQNRINAYRNAADAYARRGNAVFLIEINDDKTINRVCEEILDVVRCRH